MKRAAVLSMALAAGLWSLGAAPASAQDRPSPQGAGSHTGENAVSRPSGGGSAPSAPSSGGSSGGSSVSGGSGGSSMGSRGRTERAVPRSGGRRGSPGGPSRTGSPKSVILPAGPDGEAPDRREPASSYSRPRAGRPATGAAVPRDISNIPDLAWRRDPYWAYGYYQYSRWTPFYWGPWGGYMYYDPFWWDYYYGYGYGGYGYGGYGHGGYARSYSESDYDTGSLKFKVKPRDAQVYVDGYFSGVVDDFDGVFQKLRLRSGGHRVELRAEGMAPTIFDVLIVAGETVTYRGELKPKP